MTAELVTIALLPPAMTVKTFLFACLVIAVIAALLGTRP
jgi:hypothetical protein